MFALIKRSQTKMVARFSSCLPPTLPPPRKNHRRQFVPLNVFARSFRIKLIQLLFWAFLFHSGKIHSTRIVGFRARSSWLLNSVEMKFMPQFYCATLFDNKIQNQKKKKKLNESSLHSFRLACNRISKHILRAKNSRHTNQMRDRRNDDEKSIIQIFAQLSFWWRSFYFLFCSHSMVNHLYV